MPTLECRDVALLEVLEQDHCGQSIGNQRLEQPVVTCSCMKISMNTSNKVSWGSYARRSSVDPSTAILSKARNTTLEAEVDIQPGLRLSPTPTGGEFVGAEGDLSRPELLARFPRNLG